MDVLGSVKNRLKTMRIIFYNKKRLKIKEQNKSILEEKELILKKKEKEVQLNNFYKQKAALNKSGFKKIEISIPSVTLEKKKVKKDFFKQDDRIKNKSHNFSNSLLEKINDNKSKTHICEKQESETDNIISIFKIFVRKSKNEIKTIKDMLEKEEICLKKAETKEEVLKSFSRIEIIKEKINYLNNLYNSILERYDFEGFDEINDVLLYKYIDDFKFKSSISEIDLLVEECKKQVDYMEEINKLVIFAHKLENKHGAKKAKISYLDNDYCNRMIDYNKLLLSQSKIEHYISKEEDYLSALEKEINDNTLESSKMLRLSFDKEYINNLFKLNIGLSLFDKTLIGAFIGAFIIKNSLTPLLLGAFKKEEIIVYDYKYKEQIKKITDNLSIVKEISFLLNNSLQSINKLKKHMENEYKDYLNVGNYKILYNKLIKLEKNLNDKYEKNLLLEKKLFEQKSKNKEKQKKLKELSNSH